MKSPKIVAVQSNPSGAPLPSRQEAEDAVRVLDEVVEGHQGHGRSSSIARQSARAWLTSTALPIMRVASDRVPVKT